MNTNDLRLEWGKTLKREREKKGISRSILAAAVDVDQSTIARIEKGDRFPSEGLKMELAKALGLSLNDLFPYPLISREAVA